MSADVKFTVDYDPTSETDLGWTGVLYPTKADADWAAEWVRTNRPYLRNVHVETLDCSAPHTP
jgi:hypothetical protein